MRRIPLTNCLSLTLLGLLACADATPRPRDAAENKVVPRVAAADPPPTITLPPCTPDPRAEKPSPALKHRQDALRAVEAGQLDRATTALRSALSAKPNDLASFAMKTALELEQSRLQEELGKAAESIRPVQTGKLAPPHRVLEKPSGLTPSSGVSIKSMGIEARESDLATFIEQRKLPDPFAADLEDEQPTLPPEIGEEGMSTSIRHKTHQLSRYGASMWLLGSPREGLRAVDFLETIAEGFSRVLDPPADSKMDIDPQSIFVEARYAEVLGPLLVVLLAHDGDGLDAKPDGFLVAYNLMTNKVAWISDAGIATAHSFYATGDTIVTASGTETTHEMFDDDGKPKPPGVSDAKLHLVDLASGKTVSSMPIERRPEYVLGEGTKVFGWSYERATRYELSTATAKPKPQLGSTLRLATTWHSLPAGPTTQCWLTNAAVAFDHRDVDALSRVGDALPADNALGRGLVAASDFLRERKAGRKGIDLSEREAVVVPSPPAKVRIDGPKKVVPSVKLEPAKETPVNYQDDDYEGEMGGGPTKRGATKKMIYPINFWPGQRTDLYPMQYGNEGIGWAYASGKDVFLQYGQRYLAYVKDDELVNIFDYSQLTANTPTSRALAFVTLIDDVVYLQTVGAMGKGGFFGAFEPRTGGNLWRSHEGLLNRQPVVFADFVAVVSEKPSGKNTGELVVLERTTGKVAAKLDLTEAATDLGFDHQRGLFVGGPGGRKYFALKEK